MKQSEVPGVANGARHPELIPSLVAYRLFLRSLFPVRILYLRRYLRKHAATRYELLAAAHAGAS
jgi:hypothetical protein